jgi:hypothetical protein
MKKTITLVALGLSAVASCAAQDEGLDKFLVGVWSPVEAQRSTGQDMELGSDHKVLIGLLCDGKASQASRRIPPGTWRLVDSNTLVLTFTEGTRTMSMEQTVEVVGDNIRISDGKGPASTLRRRAMSLQECNDPRLSPSTKLRLHAAVAALVQAIDWPGMIRASLQRGDLQRAAKAKLQTAQGAACVDQKYTEQRVLDEIVAGYEQTYTDADVVSQIATFLVTPAAQKIVGAVTARTPAVGASAAATGSGRPAGWDSLTAEERSQWDAFGKSSAGKAYLAARQVQSRVHRERLANLANEVVKECSE